MGLLPLSSGGSQEAMADVEVTLLTAKFRGGSGPFSGVVKDELAAPAAEKPMLFWADTVTVYVVLGNRAARGHAA